MDTMQTLMDLADDLQRVSKDLYKVALTPDAGQNFVETAKKVILKTKKKKIKSK